jgi:transposase InsO family protein
MQTHLRTELVLEALNTALMQRRPNPVFHHSDHGCQYTSYAFGKRCREMNVMPSFGSVGDAYDNDVAESFFPTLEREFAGSPLPLREFLGNVNVEFNSGLTIAAARRCNAPHQSAGSRVVRSVAPRSHPPRLTATPSAATAKRQASLVDRAARHRCDMRFATYFDWFPAS